jgi:GNAT superfamily N-acetyltransferase
MVFRLPSDLYTVVCRPALPKDTADVMAFTRRIWDGHDYVPHYWRDWLEDPHGLLAIAEYAGHVVGMSKISWIGGNEWWLQGLRVDPDHQGKGIASHLHAYILDYWERSCRGVLRLATSSMRLPVHHLCERTGFEKVGEYLSYTAPALDAPAGSFTPVLMEDVERALGFVRQSELIRLAFGLIDLDWQWSEPGIDHLSAAVNVDHAHWWVDGGVNRGLLVTGKEEEEDGSSLTIQLAAGDLDALPKLLMDYRRLAGSKGCHLAAWMAPNREEIKDALSQAGFTMDWEHALYLYEKRLPV